MTQINDSTRAGLDARAKRLFKMISPGLMPPAMLHYKISPVPVPPTPSDIANYTTLRLLSLRTDPSLFGSSYEREIAFTSEQWRKRLDGVNKVVIIASATDTVISGGQDELEAEWVGMVTIVASSELGGFQLLPEEGNVGKDTFVYGLFGTWVHPEHRGNGLAKRMIEAGFHWVRKHAHQNDVMRDREKVVGLRVEKSNERALKVYRKTGFKMLSGVEARPGEGLIMIAKVTAEV
jgi:GNAT superfamily N-acetyltransferase